MSVPDKSIDPRLLSAAMEEFLDIAQREGIDWDALPDEWLSAIAEGDVTALLPRRSRRKNV